MACVLRCPAYVLSAAHGLCSRAQLLSDPLEEYCEGNPSEPECIVYDS